MKSKKPLSLYIHIPFCKKKCSYCDFLSFENKEDLHREYLEVLKKEIKEKSYSYKNRKVETIFIGGGTPSIYKGEDLVSIIEEIKKCFLVDENCEISLEGNPESLNEEKIEILSKAFNRISIGVQSFDDELLPIIDRIHSSKKAMDVIKSARKYFDNVNLDLIFGLPYQSVMSFKKSLDIALSLDITHISAYSLILERDVPMAREILEFPSEEDEREMYYLAGEILEKAGFIPYEISNYAKSGYQCKHNIVYWQLEEYLGLGLGSSSFTNNERYKNTDLLEDYLQGDFSPYEKRKIDKEENMGDFMLFGLRMHEGVSKKDFYKKFSMNIEDVFPTEIEKLIKQGLLVEDEKRYFLSKKGFDLGNQVFLEFLR